MRGDILNRFRSWTLKTTAEYTTVEIKEELEKVEDELSEVKKERQQAWEEIGKLKETADEEEIVRGNLIDKTNKLYAELQDCYFQINHLKST